MALCRFRGVFTSEERKRVEQAIAAAEQVDGLGLSAIPAWVVVRATPAADIIYVGVRFRDGKIVRAPALDALIAGIEALEPA